MIFFSLEQVPFLTCHYPQFENPVVSFDKKSFGYSSFLFHYDPFS